MKSGEIDYCKGNKKGLEIFQALLFVARGRFELPTSGL